MLKRRQEIYEEIYPEAKAEEKRKRKPSNDAGFCAETVSAQKNETESFTADTAKKTGLSDRTIRQGVLPIHLYPKSFLTALKTQIWKFLKGLYRPSYSNNPRYDPFFGFEYQGCILKSRF